MNNNKSIKETRMSNTIPREPNKAPSAPREILLATNGENLKYFMQSGFIHPWEGFQKYYRDLSCLSPGCLPLFINTLPPYLLSQCREEAGIDAVIISFKLLWEIVLEQASCHINNNNELIYAPPDPASQVKIVYYRGVIPVSSIRTIFFESSVIKKKFLKYQYANFNPKIFNLKIQADRFNEKKNKSQDIFGNRELTVELPPTGESFPGYNAYLESDARGGLVTMLLHALPPGPEAKDLMNYLLQPSLGDAPVSDLLPGQLKDLNSWIWNSPKQRKDVDSILLRHLLTLLESRDPGEGLTSSLFLDELSRRLEESEDFIAHGDVSSDSVKKRFKERFDQVQRAVDQTLDPSDFFNDPSIKSKVMRALLLFLLRRERVPGLSEEKTLIREWSLSAEDLLFASLLYGAWQGWHMLDDEFRPRDKKGVFAVTDFMADWFNRLHGSSPTGFFKKGDLNISENCMFWEKKILKKTQWTLSHRLGKFAVALAKQRNWPALQTKIVVPGKSLSSILYEKNGDANITITGKMSIKESLDRPQFFEALEGIELTREEQMQFQKACSG